MRKFLALLLVIGLYSTSCLAREINYNYLSSTSETVVEPFTWKNSVATYELLVAIQPPLDGEARIVLSTNKVYQYNAKLSSWVNISTTPLLDKSTIGLDNVDNTSDANKPIGTATQTALNLKANLESPSFTGNVGIGITNPTKLLSVGGSCIQLKSPDGTTSNCCVDNADGFECNAE